MNFLPAESRLRRAPRIKKQERSGTERACGPSFETPFALARRTAPRDEESRIEPPDPEADFAASEFASRSMGKWHVGRYASDGNDAWAPPANRSNCIQFRNVFARGLREAAGIFASKPAQVTANKPSMKRQKDEHIQWDWPIPLYLSLRRCRYRSDRRNQPEGVLAMRRFVNLLKDESGATAIEYGLIAALISVAAIGAMSAMGSSLTTIFGFVSTKLEEAKDQAVTT